MEMGVDDREKVKRVAALCKVVEKRPFTDEERREWDDLLVFSRRFDNSKDAPFYNKVFYEFYSKTTG